MQQRVIVAFSGGIDSCAALEILRSQGYEPIALMLWLTTEDEEAIERARQRAENLGVEFVSLDCREQFQREIIDNFVQEYVAGRTPAPCTRCNPLIKWRLLCDYADSVGVKYVATGHYFSISKYNNKLYVSRAADPRKDQSYYLWGLNQEVLSRALTPMADKIKEEVKASSTLKKESMGVCFLRGCHYSELIERSGHTIARGHIVDTKGEVVGQHRGLAYYTIGQKRGEGIPSGVAIVDIDATRNRVVVGEDKLLYRTILTIDDCNIIEPEEWLTARDITVMVRGLGRNPEGVAYVSSTSEVGVYTLHLSDPAWACAVGQPVVLYRGQRVIGGGYFRG